MIFYPISPIRHFYRYGMIFVLVGLPLCLAASSNDWVIYEDRSAVVITCILLSLAGAVLIHVGFWEKFFAVLILSENEVRWKCPLRKTITMKRAECITVGLECETTPVPGEFAYIYFASIPYPSKAERKKVVARSRNGLIKFRYTPELGEYVIKEFAPITTYTLCSYQRISKKQK